MGNEARTGCGSVRTHAVSIVICDDCDEHERYHCSERKIKSNMTHHAKMARWLCPDCMGNSPLPPYGGCICIGHTEPQAINRSSLQVFSPTYLLRSGLVSIRSGNPLLNTTLYMYPRSLGCVPRPLFRERAVVPGTWTPLIEPLNPARL